MRVIITGHDANSPNHVFFRSTVGIGRAVWKGLPVPDSGAFDVEVDIPGRFAWGSEVNVSTERDQEEMCMTEETLRIIAPMDGVEEDGSLRLLLDGGLVYIDVTGTVPATVIGKLVQFDVPALELYPFFL